MTARLDELVHRWDAGFSGRAWAPEEEVVIEAPPYADSLILTAERSVVDALIREGLEIHPVSHARRPDLVRLRRSLGPPRLRCPPAPPPKAAAEITGHPKDRLAHHLVAATLSSTLSYLVL